MEKCFQMLQEENGKNPVKFTEKTVFGETVFSGKIFDIRKDVARVMTGETRNRELIVHPGGVTILAIREGKILMVRQFRYGAGTEMLELPAGKLEKDDKDVLAAAKRELSEETGFEAQNWTDLGYIFTTPAICTEKLYLFKAENLVAGRPHPDDGEFIEHCEVEISEVYKMIQSGKINDAKTICAIFRGLGGGVL